jgi:predicted nucleic acid-binding protein
MSADFLDTNIFVYAYEAGAPEKKRIAQNLVGRALAGEMITSSQVLAEFSSVLLHKISPRADAQAVLEILRDLSPIKLVSPDGDVVRRAVEAHATYGIHFYDGLIVAAAERAGCGRIWSEDLSPGQEYFGVKVSNPFQE